MHGKDIFEILTAILRPRRLGLTAKQGRWLVRAMIIILISRWWKKVQSMAGSIFMYFTCSGLYLLVAPILILALFILITATLWTSVNFGFMDSQNRLQFVSPNLIHTESLDGDGR